MAEMFKCPAATVDLIDESEEGILLVKRRNEPFNGYWALPGGFINYGKENLRQAGAREYKEETNLNVNEDDLIIIGEYSDPGRDPRGHVISHVFYVQRCFGTPKAGDDAAEIKRFPRDRLPSLAFDHARILQDYFAFRRNNGK